MFCKLCFSRMRMGRVHLPSTILCLGRVHFPSTILMSEHFLCTNAVKAAKPHTDAARTAVHRPGATTSSPNATAAPSASFFKRDGAGTSADASGSTEASPTVEANVSQLRGTVIALSQQVSA